MCVLYFLVFKDMFKNMYTPGGAGTWLADNTTPAIIIGGLLFFLVSIALSVFTTAFPMIYLKLLKTKGDEPLISSEVFNGIKSYAGRLILFGLISFLIIFPLSIIVLGICAALSIIIIGIPMLILAIPTIMVWMMQAMYVYFYNGSCYHDDEFGDYHGWTARCYGNNTHNACLLYSWYDLFIHCL